MTEAYRTSVSLTLQNEVSAGLRQIAADMRTLARVTREAQSAMDGLGRRGFSRTTRARADGEKDGRAYGEAFAKAAQESSSRAMVSAPRLLTYSGGTGGGGGGGLVSAPMLLGYSGGGRNVAGAAGGAIRGAAGGIALYGGGSGGGGGPNGYNPNIFGNGGFQRGQGVNVPAGGGGAGGGFNGGAALMGAGQALGHTGQSWMHGLGRALHEGVEYQSQIANLRAAGESQAEVAAMIAQAWKTSGEVLTSTATGNIHTLRELRYALGDDHHAMNALSGVQRMTSVLASATGGRMGGREAFSAAKFLELRGAATDDKRFLDESRQLTAGVVASGGNVKPADYLNFAKRAGSTYLAHMSNEFLYQRAPRMMQEMGGDGAGTAIASMGQALVGGVMSQKSVEAWKRLGLLQDSGIIRSAHGGVRGIQPGAIQGTDQWMLNPEKWVTEVLGPKLAGMDDVTKTATLTRLFGNRTAARAGALFINQHQGFDRDAAQTRKVAADPNSVLNAESPERAMASFTSQWTNFKAAIGDSVMPVIVPALKAGASALNAFADAAREHPTVTGIAVAALGTVAAAITALGVAAGAAGTIVVLKAGVEALAGSNMAGAGSGLLTLAGNISKAAGILGAAGVAWQGINIAGDATKPKQDGYANLFHNFLFDANPLHWTQSYRPPATPAAPATAPAAPSAGAGADQAARPGRISYAPSRDGSQREAHIVMMLDRRVVGEASTRYQAREAERPLGSRNAFDGRRSLVPV